MANLCPCCGGTFILDDVRTDFLCEQCGALYNSFAFPEQAADRIRVVVERIPLPRLAGLDNELWLMYSDGPLSDMTIKDAVQTELPSYRWLSTFRRMDGAPVRELQLPAPTYGAYRTRVLVASTPRVTKLQDVLEAHCVDMLSTLTSSSLSGDRNA